MHTLVTNQLLPALSWTLVHSLWQGLVLTVLAGLVVLLTRRSTAALRYSLLCTLFFLFLGGVAISFFVEWNAGGMPPALGQTIAVSAGTMAASSPLVQRMEEATAFLNANAQWIVLPWLLVFVFKAGKTVVDTLYIRRLRRCKTFAPGKHWTERVQTLSHELGIHKQISLLESALVKVPVVIGYFKPLILLPAGILTHMPASELEAIILHELAHIRRHDYLINYIQCLSELLFFFNPGLLWVSSLLRIERENCCDDMAISHTKNKMQFVEALLRCKEHSLTAPGYALGLFGKKNFLLQRLTRIIYNRNQTLSLFEAAFFILSLLISTVLLSGMGIVDRPVRPAPAHPLIESKFSLYDSAAKESTTGHLPKQEITKGIKKRLRTEIVKKVFFHPTGQKNQIPVYAAEVLEADQSLADNHSPAFLTSTTIPEPISESRSQLGEAGFEALRLQAERDRKQAEKDRAQAERDREQAQKDRAQAGRDREQAQKDRTQAQMDRQQAEKDREQSAKDRTQAQSDRLRGEQDQGLRSNHQ